MAGMGAEMRTGGGRLDEGRVSAQEGDRAATGLEMAFAGNIEGVEVAG